MSSKGQKYTKRNHFNEADLRKYYTVYSSTLRRNVTSQEWIDSLRAAVIAKGHYGRANFAKREY